VKRQRRHVEREYDGQRSREPFELSDRPGRLIILYFSCGIIAVIGFFTGGFLGFTLAILIDIVLFMLVLLLKRHN
jgi:hypothetical protein